MTHSPILLLLDALACFRLTQLVTTDVILAPARDRLIGRTLGRSRDLQGNLPPIAARPRVAEFITCPWCVSIWLAVAVVLLQAFLPAVCLIVSAVLAFSAVSGLLAGLA